MTDAGPPPEPRLALRRAVLAVSVLDDVDFTPHPDGVVLGQRNPVLVSWADVEEAIGPHRCGPIAYRRLSQCLRLHRLVADLGPGAGEMLRHSARLLALPEDHAFHPGPGWTVTRRMGGALETGIGLLGVLNDRDEVVALPASVARALGPAVRQWWPEVVEHADGMGQLCANRLRRDQRSRHLPQTSAALWQLVLRPVGGVDVPTLLTTRAVRGHLASSDGSGMRAVAAPTRSRGWYDLARIDLAFVSAAWAATDERARGLRRPLLVTADEVVLAPDRGDRVAAALADPVSGPTFQRGVGYG